MARTARSSADCRDKQERQQRSDPTAAAPAPASAAGSTTADGACEACTASPHPHPITPAEYIYQTMLPPSKPSQPVGAAKGLPRPIALGKRDRSNTGGSSTGPMLSMDLYLNSEDLQQVDIGDLMGGVSALSSGDVAMKCLQSSDIVQGMLLPDMPLPDVAKTAAGALKGGTGPRLSQPLKAAPQSQPQASDRGIFPGERPNRTKDDACPVDGLALQMQRISTGDDIVPLDEDIRISSSSWEWREGLGVADPGPMDPSLFANNRALRYPSPPPLSKSAPANSYVGYSNDGSERAAPLELVGSSQEDWERVARLAASPLAHNPPPLNPSYRAPPSLASAPLSPPSDPVAAAPAARGASSSLSTASKRRKKKSRKRVIDESVAVEPTDGDVLFGRGGFTNTHPGNIKFRAKALELRPWYEQSTTTKEEKYQISDMLVESVRGCGHRFLERGSDGKWHEVIGNGARKKASQALRERMRGQRRSGGSAGGSKSSPAQAGTSGEKVSPSLAVSGDVVGV